MNNNSFKFSIKITPFDLNDVEEVLSSFKEEEKKHNLIAKMVVDEATIIADEKWKKIKEQLSPLISTIIEFNGDSRKIYQISACYLYNKAEYKARIEISRNGGYTLFISGYPNEAAKFEVESLINENIRFAMENNNPFSCWNKWGIFSLLKENLVEQIVRHTNYIKKDTKALLNMENMLND